MHNSRRPHSGSATVSGTNSAAASQGALWTSCTTCFIRRCLQILVWTDQNPAASIRLLLCWPTAGLL